MICWSGSKQQRYEEEEEEREEHRRHYANKEGGTDNRLRGCEGQTHVAPFNASTGMR